MVRRANYIPRTLIGANGVRLYDIPGVTYPDKMLSNSSQHVNVDQGGAPVWGITTREAAKILNCSESSARIFLRDKEVRCSRLENSYGLVIVYWDREQVHALASARIPYVKTAPRRLMSSAEAMAYLNISTRYALRSYAKAGLLREVQLRMRSRTGIRTYRFYPRAQVYRLARARQSMPYLKGLLLLMKPEKLQQQ